MGIPKEIPIGKPKRRKPTLESKVVRECLAFLKQHPRVIYVERRNTGAVKFQDGGFMRFGSKGAADIFCLLNKAGPNEINGLPIYWHGHPIHCEIECKSAKGRLSQPQKEFREFCDKHGIPYFLARSVKDLDKALKAWYNGENDGKYPCPKC